MSTFWNSLSFLDWWESTSPDIHDKDIDFDMAALLASICCPESFGKKQDKPNVTYKNHETEVWDCFAKPLLNLDTKEMQLDALIYAWAKAVLSSIELQIKPNKPSKSWLCLGKLRSETEMEEFLWTDTESLYAKLKYQQKHFKLKRRWLMGLTLSDSEQQKLIKMKLQENKTLPESFLREDDVYFETIKAFVEKGFGACNYGRDHCAGGIVEFEKTRWKMKKIIRELLPEVLENWKDKDKNQLADDICQLLKDPGNFRSRATLFTPSPKLYRASVTKVLDRLENMPIQTLTAMHRKLRDVHGYVPQLQHSKTSECGRILIGQVRKSCMAMLSELDEEDELQEPLAKAIAVGSLSLKHLQDCPFIMPEFLKFSPEIEALQNGLAKAIRLLEGKSKFPFPELKKLQLLLDPNMELPSRKLRFAVKKLLTEYLLECNDMDRVPEYLLEALSFINKTCRSAPYGFLSKEELEEDVECILSVSAQIKQVSWDLLPEYEFDLDFADAYMEDLEESDDGDGYDINLSVDQQEVVLPRNDSCHSHDPYDQIEIIGETDPANSESPNSPIEKNKSSPVFSPNRRLSCDSLQISEPEHVTMDLVDSSASSASSFELDGAEDFEGNSFNIGSARVLELSDPHSLALKTTPSGFSPHISPITEFDQSHVEGREPNVDQGKSPDFVSSNFSSRGNFMHYRHGMSRNQYVAVQEACDKTSIVAYRLIGHVLDEFAQIEDFKLDGGDVTYLRGDSSIQKDTKVGKEDQVAYEGEVPGSIIIQALEELLPSFPESGKERVKESVDSRPHRRNQIFIFLRGKYIVRSIWLCLGLGKKQGSKTYTSWMGATVTHWMAATVTHWMAIFATSCMCLWNGAYLAVSAGGSDFFSCG
ncbi:hypothetical protein Vadar_028562 [Vaccinium darrowii]|uniref:Uncharacterized protein n=1 Tax=Vaccinium darrowii TaxID=229202 RepID=A0ACB7X4H0_9ERIC|nr:hypothetical protein Vadar_028562 [Vaccinium darrowii]